MAIVSGIDNGIAPVLLRRRTDFPFLYIPAKFNIERFSAYECNIKNSYLKYIFDDKDRVQYRATGTGRH